MKKSELKQIEQFKKKHDVKIAPISSPTEILEKIESDKYAEYCMRKAELGIYIGSQGEWCQK